MIALGGDVDELGEGEFEAVTVAIDGDLETEFTLLGKEVAVGSAATFAVHANAAPAWL